MAPSSKLLDDVVVEKAKIVLKKIGRSALCARKLEAVISAKKHGIEIHYLPPYRPNLNPIERLWKVNNVRNNVFFSSAKEFKHAIFSFFENTWKNIDGR